MSGDAVALLDDGSGSIARLVQAAAKWFGEESSRSAALVGGLAVTVRLATVHRATDDVDTVVDDSDDGTLVSVTDDHAARVEIDGVKIDVMSTSPLPVDAQDLPDDDHDRLFVLGHRWALETATPVSVAVRGATEIYADLTVATASALLACKLHAIADRRDARAAKRESDARDIYRLIRLIVRVPELADAFAEAPFDLAALVVAGVRRWLIDDLTRTARLLTISTSTGEAPVESAELAALGRLFTGMVSHS